MVLDLAIQTTAEKSSHCAVWGKIGRSMHLMDGPGFMNITPVIGNGKRGSLNGMSQLENESQH